MYVRFSILIAVSTTISLYCMEHETQATPPLSHVTIYAPSGTPVGHQNKLTYYTKSGIIHGHASWSFNFPDTPQDPKERKIKEKQSFGQGEDITKLARVIKESKNHENNRYILHGTSRGAAAILHLMKEPEKYGIPTEQIAALVLEAPYANVRQVIEHFLNDPKKHDPYNEVGGDDAFSAMRSFLSNWIPKFFALPAAEEELKRTTAYNPSGPQPCDDMENIDDVPTLIIGSKEDTQIPIEGPAITYSKLRETGHTKTHLYKLDHGEHDQYAISESKNNYRAIVHAFYKQYNLPHNQKYAKEGKEDFPKTQPHL